MHELPLSSSSSSQDKPRSCPYCWPVEMPHPLWVYMLTISEEGVHNQVLNCAPQIGISRNPLVRVKEQNREVGFAPGSKNSLSGAPYWQVELIIGPFTKQGGSFKQDWLQNSRTALRRFVYGILLAKSWNDKSGTELIIYARNKDNAMRLMREEAWHIAT